MAENCTLYCKILNVEEITRLVRAHFPPSTATMEESISVAGIEGSMRLTKKVLRQRGDDFCRLLLSTCTFVKSMSSPDPDKKKQVVSHIQSCELVVGVVADPAFDADERYHDVVFAIAKALDAVVFNGQEMLNANGEVLLSVP